MVVGSSFVIEQVNSNSVFVLKCYARADTVINVEAITFIQEEDLWSLLSRIHSFFPPL